MRIVEYDLLVEQELLEDFELVPFVEGRFVEVFRMLCQRRMK